MRHIAHVDIEIAKLLKEVGFNEDCDYRYISYNCRICRALPKNNDTLKRVIKGMEGSSEVMVKNIALENNETLKFFNKIQNGSYTVSEEMNYAAPTIEHVMNWLRIEKNIHLVALPDNDGIWYTYVYDVQTGLRKSGAEAKDYYTALKTELKNILNTL